MRTSGLESEIRKTQTDKEIVVAVFFDIEKVYDMKEGLLIKLDKLGLEGRCIIGCWVSCLGGQ